MEEFFGTPTLGQKISKFVREHIFEVSDKFKSELSKEFDIPEDEISFNQDYTEVYVRTGGVTYVARLCRNIIEEMAE